MDDLAKKSDLETPLKSRVESWGWRVDKVEAAMWRLSYPQVTHNLNSLRVY